MQSTFDTFFENHPDQQEPFDREYADFALSELILEAMESEHLSVRELAKRAHVSPTIIQKLRSNDAEKITLHTLLSVLTPLGYRMKIEKTHSLHR